VGYLRERLNSSGYCLFALLSHFELAEAKLLQIVLSGQTELGDLLNRQDLRQLKQRVSVRLAIHPLSAAGVEHYIQHRWQKAAATAAHSRERPAAACELHRPPRLLPGCFDKPRSETAAVK
jgi:general secretion pathway protein A